MRKYWKSLRHRSNDEKFKEENSTEFPKSKKGASVLQDYDLTRRSFLKTMGASLMLAGVSSCAAIRKIDEKIYPYAKSPEGLVPGNPTYYATSYALGEQISGLLGKSMEGRPIKMEGNPLYPENLGKTSSFHQASLINLYNPDRLAKIVSGGSEQGVAFLRKWLSDAFGETGEKTGILFNQVSSLTTLNLLNEIKSKFPGVNFYEYSPINNRNVYQGIKAITGEEAYPLVDLKKAKVVVSLDADFLGLETHSLRYSREFMSKRRDVDPSKFNRLYQFENTFSITGGVADNRFLIKRNDVELIGYAILNELYQKSISRINRSLISEIERKLIDSASELKKLSGFKNISKIVDDLYANRGEAVVMAGSHLSPFTHSIVYYINEILSAPVAYYAPLPLKSELFGEVGENSIEQIITDANEGRLSNLLVFDGNPVYDSYANLDFKSVYERLNTLYLSEGYSVTAELSNVVVPKKNYLESWSDNASSLGMLAVVQPLITPLFENSFSEIDLLALILGKNTNPLQEVKTTLAALNVDWKSFVHQGFVENTALDNGKNLNLVDLNGFIRRAIRNNQLHQPSQGIEVTLSPDYSVYDGRYINNSWLQELPDPISKMTWDNAIFIAHKNARELDLKNYDLVELEISGRKVRGAIWVIPGQVEDSITLKLGYGQNQNGRVAEGSGFDFYKVYFNDPSLYLGGVSIRKLNEEYILASVQDHWMVKDEYFEGGPSSNSQDERPLVRGGSLEEYAKNPYFVREEVKLPELKEEHERLAGKKGEGEKGVIGELSIFSEIKYDKGYQWGMAIDLSTCTGCNACVISCQAENNIPVVGKEMVLKGREMHWIRLDRYFEGEVDNPRMVHQPVNCMQCELAPCEQVCPVEATVHSKEGLNDMVYNRCIGTRFCSNNCPFKVRRFNFFDYHQRSPYSQKKVSSHLFELFREPSETLQLEFNPDVTVRMRGVMEKCTYCVQRINKTRVKSRNEGRKIRDGEIKTACEQACPTSSITFGDVNDPSTKVSLLKKRDRNYGMLEELNLKPRTTYLAGINNPNPAIRG